MMFIIRRFIAKSLALYKKFIIFFVILALPVGVMLAKFIPQVMNLADTLVSKFIDGIVFFAPIAIFMILAPSVAKMMKTRKESKFAGFVILWFGMTRIVAGIWAAIFTVIILKLPLLPGSQTESINLGHLVIQNLITLKDLMFSSVFFLAIWISIIVGIIAYFKKKVYNILQKAADSIELLGNYIEPIIPILMLLLGAYIYSLPQTLAESVSADTMNSIAQADLGKISFLGNVIDINSEFGLLWVYIVGSVMIGVGCFLWQMMQILVVKKYIGHFSIKDFFKNYWTKVYPLAWSTSSEVVSMPLNMALVKTHYNKIEGVVRRLVVGLGAYMNINGTTMHVILLAGIVSVLVGFRPSLLQLVLGVPLIALIGYGVPGIPGELVLFAVPMVKILNLPDHLIALFMSLYLALQIGLPDSFRTGANVTDNGIYAIGLNKLFKKRFAAAELTDKQIVIQYIKKKAVEKRELSLAPEYKAQE